jgi:hypothetical protein
VSVTGDLDGAWTLPGCDNDDASLIRLSSEAFRRVK